MTNHNEKQEFLERAFAAEDGCVSARDPKIFRADPKQDTSLAEPDPTKLADWLAILQLPEVGERVCQAAGFTTKRQQDGQVTVHSVLGYGLTRPSATVVATEDDPIETHITAALALGGLAVLAGDDGEGWLCCYDEPDEWSAMDYEGLQRGHGASLPSAVLAALYRVYGPFGDGG